MKKQIHVVALGASLLLAGAAFAQDVPTSGQVPPPPPGEATPPPPPPGAMPAPAPDPSMPPPAADAPPPPPTGADGSMSAPMPPAAGQVSVNSGPAPAKPSGPAPDFASLSGGKGGISEAQASAYPLLANDFEHADSNRDGKVSKAEYAKWVTQSGASGQ